MKHPVDVIVPTCRSTNLVECLIKSFTKFSEGYDFNFYIIENSNYVDDNEYIRNLAPKIVIHNNPVDFSDRPYAGSYYNASGCEVGLKLSSSNLIFFAHNDVMATKENWLKSIHEKIELGYGAAGFLHDNIRINALHISGLLTTRDIAKNINLYCRFNENNSMILDVGDEITEYCRNNNLQVFNHKNTHNMPQLAASIKQPYSKLNVVRCLDENDDVIFMHCGRGTPKVRGNYNGQGSGINAWINFANSYLDLNVKV